MFDFFNSDEFVIGLEIVFLTFIVFDVYKYIKTRQKQYVLNIVLAIVFAIWVLYPFYIKYYMWEDKDREAIIQECLKEHNSTYCTCVDDAIFKVYDEVSYNKLDKQNDKEFIEFIKDTEKECFED